jgi:excinuclease ABC subunit B
MDETNRRRRIQQQYNEENNITPETIRKNITDVLSSLAEQDYVTVKIEEDEDFPDLEPSAIEATIEALTREMFEAARDLEFEKAAELRDKIRRLENSRIAYGVGG